MQVSSRRKLGKPAVEVIIGLETWFEYADTEVKVSYSANGRDEWHEMSIDEISEQTYSETNSLLVTMSPSVVVHLTIYVAQGNCSSLTVFVCRMP